MSRVLVIGASGELGHRVVVWLRELCPGLEILGASRSGTGPAGVPMLPADVTHAGSLRAALAGVRVVVNAVGPYRWDPNALVKACVASGCHYVDLAEDAGFLRAVGAAAARHGAAEAGVALVPGCSTVPGLVDVLARHAATPAAASVEAWLSMGSRNPVSAGLLTGLLRPLGRRREGGRWFDRVEQRRIGSRRLSFAPYPGPWLDGVTRVAGRPLPVELHVGFDRGWITRALSLSSRLLGRLPESAVPRLVPVLLPLVRAARPFGTSLGALAVRLLDADGAEVARVEVHAASRGLDVPALPAAWAVQALLAAAPAGGTLELGDLVSGAEAVTALGTAGYTVVSDSPLAAPPV